MQSSFKSDIVLEVWLLTTLPSIQDSLVTSYTITYKIDYGRVQGKWNEHHITQGHHKSRSLALEYIFGT